MLQNFHPAAGKGVNFNCGGKTKDPGHFRSTGQLRIDGQTQAQVLLDEADLLHVFWAPHPGDGVLGSRPLGNEAGQQILLVGVGGGNQQIRLLHTGLPLDLQGGAVALNGHNIQALYGMLQGCGPLVNDGHVMTGFGEPLGKGAAHFAVHYNDDAHVGIPPAQTALSFNIA